MSKRILSATALFVCMCLVGGGMAVVLSSTAMAGPNPNDCSTYECEEGYFALMWLSCLRFNCDGDYAVWECDGRCPGGGKCSCEFAGCWEGFLCE